MENLHREFPEVTLEEEVDPDGEGNKNQD
jgi:hypothetical protein